MVKAHSVEMNKTFFKAAPFLLLLTMATVVNLAGKCDAVLLKEIEYYPETNFDRNGGLRMNLTSAIFIAVKLTFDTLYLPAKLGEKITISFRSVTISPQFQILNFVEPYSKFSISRKDLERKNIHNGMIRIRASYIGHALIQPEPIIFSNNKSTGMQTNYTVPKEFSFPVVVEAPESIWNVVFVVSVALLMIISYINLGAQLDMENIRQMIKMPKTIILGYLVTLFVMPVISWFAGLWLLPDQIVYRMGAFIFAIGPAASASTLWTVMLNSDKELSVGLQVVSTVASLVTMPLLLFFMETSMLTETSKSTIKVPYARLTQTLFVLLVALFIGWRYVGHNERAQKISRRIFRPLTFFVLIFIIVFSSIVYWYMYVMFDWTITFTAFVITFFTYLVAGLLGQLINFNKDHAVAISISSTYKNSGIAFAVLLVAFDPPTTYIAYVPCLTQVVTTSLTLYLVYFITKIINRAKGGAQPVPTRDSDKVSEAPPTTAPNQTGAGDEQQAEPLSTAGGNHLDKDEKSEFIAMNVTEVGPIKPYLDQNTDDTAPQSG